MVVGFLSPRSPSEGRSSAGNSPTSSRSTSPATTRLGLNGPGDKSPSPTSSRNKSRLPGLGSRRTPPRRSVSLPVPRTRSRQSEVGGTSPTSIVVTGHSHSAPRALAALCPSGLRRSGTPRLTCFSVFAPRQVPSRARPALHSPPSPPRALPIRPPAPLPSANLLPVRKPPD